MEFHIKTLGAPPDLGAINQALNVVDPMAMADLDPLGATCGSLRN